MTPVDIKPEFDETSFKNVITPLLNHERELLVFQTVHQRADASRYPVEVHLQLVEGYGASVFLAIILDITKRKQAEENLRKLNEELEERINQRTEELHLSEKYLRAVVEGQIEYISRWKPDGTLMFVNQQYADLYQTTKEDLIGTNFFEYLMEIDQKEIEHNLKMLSPETPVITNEFFSRSKHSKGRWFQWTIHGFFDSHGKLTGIQSVGFDISERKKAEAELSMQKVILERSNSLSSALSQIASKIAGYLDTEEVYKVLEDELDKLEVKFFVGLVDPKTQDLIVQYLGIESKTQKAIKKLLGVTIKGYRIARENFPIYEELIEKKNPQIISDYFTMAKQVLPNFPDALLNGMNKLIGIEGKFTVFHLPLVTDKGVIGDLCIWGSGLEEDDILPFSIFAGLVANAIRVSDLYQQAQAANQAKTEFLSRMSHELRTPMNSILGFAQLLEISQKDPLTEGQRDRVLQIVDGGKHLLNLINEILDISRIEAGRLQVSPEPVRVLDVLREVNELAVPLAEPRHIHIELQEPDGMLYLLADQQRLKQVLLNLLSNAIKYNHQGGRVILTHEKRPENHLRILVRDTGKGIAPEKIEKLFVPFERLDAETSQVEGTGLGLVLSKRLVELMGGQIGVESKVGVGSSFWFELPTSDDPSAHFLDVKKSTVSQTNLKDTSMKILYIEDNPANFELVRQVLDEYPQIELIGETHAQAGIKTARQQRPDLILLDLHLPGIDGQQALGLLKLDEKTQSIPVVVLSADATPGRIQRLIDQGAEAYLTKPLNIKEFISLIDVHMKKINTS